MTRRSAVGVVAVLPIALSLICGPASVQVLAQRALAQQVLAQQVLAQDGSTTIRKSSPPAAAPEQSGGVPESALRPSIGQEVLPPDNAAPVGEIEPEAVDEGTSWDAAVEVADAPTPLIGDEQADAVKRINDYFNGITNLQGKFEQIDPSNKRTTGKFYVQRPGKIRFDYAKPAELQIVSDGNTLAIVDTDLKTIEKYPIKKTPFRLLLADEVNLGRDARIVGVERQEGTLAISLEDEKGEAAGRIKLTLKSEPQMELSEWLITDAQGLTTQVTVREIAPRGNFAPDWFTPKDPRGTSPFGQ